MESNTANLYLDIHEGKITKIKNIYFVGNDNFDSNVLRSEIKSKIKSLSNIFANNNFNNISVYNFFIFKKIDSKFISQIKFYYISWIIFI